MRGLAGVRPEKIRAAINQVLGYNDARLQQVASQMTHALVADRLTARALRGSELLTALVSGLLEHLDDHHAELMALHLRPEEIRRQVPVAVLEGCKPRQVDKLCEMVRSTLRQVQGESGKLHKLLTDHAALVGQSAARVPQLRETLDGLEAEAYAAWVEKPAARALHPQQIYDALAPVLARVAQATETHHTLAALRESPLLPFLDAPALNWYVLEAVERGLVSSTWNDHRGYFTYRPTKKGLAEYQRLVG